MLYLSNRSSYNRQSITCKFCLFNYGSPTQIKSVKQLQTHIKLAGKLLDKLGYYSASTRSNIVQHVLMGLLEKHTYK